MIQIDRSAITDTGSALLNAGDPISITSVKTGSGTYTAEEDLTGRTSLKNQQYSYTPSSVVVDGAQRTINALISNMDPLTEEAIVTTSYTMKEIGVFVTVDGVEELFAIGISYEGANIPAYTGQNRVDLVLSWVMEVSGGQTITVVNYGAAALATDMTDAQAKILALMGDLAKIETSTTAANDYSKGDFLVTSDGQLYMAKAAITAGDTLEVGTNIKTITLGEEVSFNKSYADTLANLLGQVILNINEYETNLASALYDHAVGDIFPLMNATIAKATAAISRGDALVENTNYVLVTWNDLLGELNNAIASKVDDTDVIDLAHGGTNATTASDARTNLGLGTAATKNSTTSITNTSSTVATPSAVYSYTRPVVITSSSSSAPSDTRALWVYPA